MKAAKACKQHYTTTMGEYFANEIVQSCAKGYETEVTEMDWNYPFYLTVYSSESIQDTACGNYWG